MKNFIITLLLTAFFATLSILAQAQVEITPNFSTSDQVDTVLPPLQFADSILPPAPPSLYVYDTLQKRKIYWIHGLAGDQSSWDDVASIVAGYYFVDSSQFIPLNVAYSNNSYYDDQGEFLRQGMPDIYATLELEQVPPGSTYDSAYSFAIAHSLGGIVGRSLRHMAYVESDLPAQFSGLVTFGTPHGGAKVVNNSRNNGLADYWLSDGCERLGNAELQDFISEKFLSDILLTNSVSDIVEGVCGILSGTVLDKLMDGVRRPMAQSIRTGAPEIAMLKNHQDTIPAINVVGVEQEPVFWRMLFSMRAHDSLAAERPFGLDEDQIGVDEIETAINSYRAKEQDHRWRMDWYASFARLSIYRGQILKANIFNELRQLERAKYFAYRGATEWLNLANNNWKRVIGARYDSTFLDGYWCRCIDENSPGLNVTFTHVSSWSDCNSSGTSICTSYPNITTHTVNKANDGVVLLRSQSDWPGSIRLTMLDANHMQMRNMDRTKEILTKLTEGYYGVYFRTKPKDQ